MSEKKIGLREVRALTPGEIVWDGAVAGFGVRRQRSTRASYFLYYRTSEGRQRWQTIGRHGSPWTPQTARAEAQRLLGDVVKGADPAAAKRARRQAKDVTELCDLYFADAEAGRLLTRRKKPKKLSTLEIDKGRIARHIKPLLGQLKVAAVTTEDVDTFMHDVAAGKTAGKTKSGKKRGLARVRGGKTAARPIFRLADLAAANGLAVRQAHDAMHDVELTLQLCQRVREGAPDLWSSFMRFASKAAVVDFVAEESVFGYFDNFGGTRCVRPLTRVAVSPRDQNLHYCLDLTNDIGALRALSDDELAEIVGGYDSPVRKLKVNASPFLCPLWELDHDHLAPSDEGELTRLAQSIQADEVFIARLTTAALSSERIYGPSEHVELQIYGKGWPSDEDIKLCRDFHASPWEHRLEIAMRLSDTRLRRLGRRLVYFERADLLRGTDRDDFDAEVSRRVRGGEGDFPWMTVPRALAELDQLMAAAPAVQHGIIQALRDELLAR